MTRLVPGILFVATVAIRLSPACAVEGRPVKIDSAHLIEHVANPAGLQVGFWANYRRSADVVRDFGPRAIERVNFHKWRQHETQPGVYDFDSVFEWERWAHLAGSTVITNVNTFFTRRLNPQGMDAIPAHYTPDIDDPQTRAAAREYLKAFTQRLLRDVGAAWLVLDYEMIWFAKPTTPQIRQSYRNWFIEAAAVCRATAAAMGLADQLKIGVIVNTDPYDTAGHSLGSPAQPQHQPQTWLLDCIRAADFLGIDTYAGGHAGITTPDHQLRAIRFWIQHYALDRPVYITESGFSTSREAGDVSHGYHIRGTDSEQALFFAAMLDALVNARQRPEDPLSRVRAYCIWAYADREDEADLMERHFGLLRSDGSRKPAHAAVAQAITKVEADSNTSPSRTGVSSDVTAAIQTGQPIAILRRSGADYTSITIQFNAPAQTDRQVVLEIQTADPICLIARVNGLGWLTTHPTEGKLTRLELPPLPMSSPVEIDLVFTSSRYPLQTQVTGLGVSSLRKP